MPRKDAKARPTWVAPNEPRAPHDPSAPTDQTAHSEQIVRTEVNPANQPDGDYELTAGKQHGAPIVHGRPVSWTPRQSTGRSAWSRRSRKSKLLAAGAALAIVAVCLAVRYFQGSGSASAEGPNAPSPQNQGVAQNGGRSSQQAIVAVVNGEEIHREELGNECISHYGKEVLKGLLNKHLISQYCAQRKIEITQGEIRQEIEHTARRFNLPVDQWLKLLDDERNITPEQYANDVVWPIIALRKLAAAQLTVTPEELRNAFESQYGEAVKCRVIMTTKIAKAREALAQVRANADAFGAVAKLISEDVTSASAEGWVQPVRHHGSAPAFEQAVFSLRDHEISDIVQVGDQFIIVKCEGRLPASNVSLDKVRDRLEESVKDHKLPGIAGDVFKALQKDARIENVFENPERRDQLPGGVAALVNDRRITMHELAEECIARHGNDVLKGAIHRHLLEQALRLKHLTISQEDIQGEIARAAVSMGKVLQNGQPDIDGWIKSVTEQPGVTYELYVRDAVWPSVALKKLVGEVKITDDDIRKGYIANYGQRVRCRAIVMANSRKAQEVWEMARQHSTPEAFGKLAEQYSVEPSSRALKGVVPPLRQYGGQPKLEEEAFKLKTGELSGIVQVGDKFIILFCEGRTEPDKIQFEEVRQIIVDDIHEKKQRIAMGDEFERLKAKARIDNYLTGETQSPDKKVSKGSEPARTTMKDGNVLPATVQFPGQSGGAPGGAQQRRSQF